MLLIGCITAHPRAAPWRRKACSCCKMACRNRKSKRRKRGGGSTGNHHSKRQNSDGKLHDGYPYPNRQWTKPGRLNTQDRNRRLRLSLPISVTLSSARPQEYYRNILRGDPAEVPVSAPSLPSGSGPLFLASAW